MKTADLLQSSFHLLVIIDVVDATPTITEDEQQADANSRLDLGV